MNGVCAECKREGEVIPQAVANAKNEIVIRYLHVACVNKWLEKYHAWRDTLTSNGSTNLESTTALDESGTSATSARQSRET